MLGSQIVWMRDTVVVMPTRLATKCAKCKKTIACNTGKSFTAWLFRPAECACELERSMRVIAKTGENKVADLPTMNKVADSSTIGRILNNRYKVLSLLGTGGMGSVYRVLDLQQEREFALKIISPDLADQAAHPCLSGTCFGCTDQAAGSSSLSASAAAAVACTLSGV